MSKIVISKNKLLVEKDAGFVSSNPNITQLNESTTLYKPQKLELTSNGGYKMYALLQKAEAENRNGRIYRRSLLEREIKKYAETQIRLGNSIGEVTHPESSEVDPRNAPFRIIKIWWEGNSVYGELEFFVSTPYKENGTICNIADEMCHLLSFGVTLGISSRGVGSLFQQNGKNYVEDDFELICWDIVHSPSTLNAFLYTKDSRSVIDKLESEIQTESSTDAISNKESEYSEDESMKKLRNLLNNI
jgi:hypothetical protein